MDFFIALLNLSEYIFWFVLVFTLIVFVHEFGHYYVAKLNGVEVEKFSIGFGSVLFSKIDKNKTKWQLCAIPLGGYVKFSGEMYPNNKDLKKNKDKKLFMNKKALQKASIVFAGPLANFILSFLLFITIFFFFGKNQIDPIVGEVDKNSPAENIGILVKDKILSLNNTKVDSYDQVYSFLENTNLNKISLEILRDNKIIYKDIIPEKKTIKTFIGSERVINYLGIKPIINPVVGSVISGSPAMSAGILKNDKIIKINNIEIIDARKVINIVKSNPEKLIYLTVLRKGELINVNIIPKRILENNIGQIGISFKRQRIKLNFYASLNLALKSIIEISIKTLVAFYEILANKRDHCEVGGPILIAKVSNDVANTDIISFVALIAIISINLGLINLFPLPLLDGGHFFTYISEFIIGKSINYNIFKIVQIIGVIIIFSFMAFSILNDIYCRILN